MSKDNIINQEPSRINSLHHAQRARSLLTQAVEAEVADFLGKHADLKIADGRCLRMLIDRRQNHFWAVGRVFGICPASR